MRPCTDRANDLAGRAGLTGHDFCELEAGRLATWDCARISRVNEIPNPAAAELETGWARLGRGKWAEARQSFRRAVEQEGSPEAYEGLSWAAWWLDRADETFEARRRAYSLYKQQADPSSAARMATWLAADEADFHGATAVAQGWLQRAHRLLDPIEPGPDHGWLAFHEGFLSGDTDVMRLQAVRAAALGRQFGVADLEMLGLALEGAALVSCAEVADGMRCLDEATAMALEGQATIPISGAWAFCFLVSACTSVLDYERAVQWCDRIADFAGRYGSRFMLGFCGAEYGDVNLWRGRWSEAERALESSIADFSSSRPAWVSEPTVRLAELRRRQGRGEEALRLLQGISTGAAQLCRARLALDRGDAARCADLAERVLRQIPDHQLTGLVPVLELLAGARRVQGDLPEAQAVLQRLKAAASRIGTAPVRALCNRAEGQLAAAGGEHDRARPLLEDAVDGFRRCDAVYDAACAGIDLAATLMALGRGEEAGREAAAAVEALDRMGARIETERGRRLMSSAGSGTDAAIPALTGRERQVLALVARGCTNRAIAERLVVSEHTVHRHVTNILRKLDLPSRTAAAAWAIRNDLPANP